MFFKNSTQWGAGDVRTVDFVWIEKARKEKKRSKRRLEFALSCFGLLLLFLFFWVQG
jgi:hypothetical protein